MPKKGADKGHVNEGAEISDAGVTAIDSKGAQIKYENEVEKVDLGKEPEVKFKNGNGKNNGNGKKGKGKDVKRGKDDQEKGDFLRSESATESCGKSEISTCTTSIVLDGKEDGNSSNEDKDKDDEDDLPKEPKLDGYFVVLGVIFVGTIVGVLVYFALADIVDPPRIISKEEAMPGFFKHINRTTTIKTTTLKTTVKKIIVTEMEDLATQEASTEPPGGANGK